MKPDPTFNLDTAWIAQGREQQAILLFFALHHYKEQAAQGRLGVAWWQQFSAEWLDHLMSQLEKHSIEKEGDCSCG